jgi:hypothetical protein
MVRLLQGCKNHAIPIRRNDPTLARILHCDPTIDAELCDGSQLID